MCVRRESFTHVQVPTEPTRIGFSWSRSYRKGELPSLGVRTPQVRRCVNFMDKQCVQHVLCGSWKCKGTPLVVTAVPFLLKELQDRYGGTSTSEFRYVLEEREAVLCWDSLFLQQPALARSNS